MDGCPGLEGGLPFPIDPLPPSHRNRWQLDGVSPADLTERRAQILAEYPPGDGVDTQMVGCDQQELFAGTVHECGPDQGPGDQVE